MIHMALYFIRSKLVIIYRVSFITMAPVVNTDHHAILDQLLSNNIFEYIILCNIISCLLMINYYTTFSPVEVPYT